MNVLKSFFWGVTENSQLSTFCYIFGTYMKNVYSKWLYSWIQQKGAAAKRELLMKLSSDKDCGDRKYPIINMTIK